ncbi:hypothetical protein N7470_006108 [Penicillium chermesinum]|nr:hypothetical protein N7470_006108 [Penicillium chermesinum]
MESDSQGEIPLEPNKIHGPWESAGQYLRTHYNLLREDVIAPLRIGVAQLRENCDMNDSKEAYIYEKVHVVRVTMAQKGLAFRIRFSTKRSGKKIVWKYSSRLTTGSVVALSPVNDRFSSICSLAVVASRSIDNVQKSPPEVDICFADQGDLDFDPQQEWVMVEARTGYYEAHRHVLMALQKLSKEDLNTAVDPPDYIKVNPVLNFKSLLRPASQSAYQIAGVDEPTRFNVLDIFPTTPMGGLNNNQQAALKQILTKKLAIIQGPPGTGKTFVSVAALKILLSEMVGGAPPIIIATQTNHALDQLICHISKFESNFIRLGGRSNIEAIRKRTLYEIRHTHQPIDIQEGMMHPAKIEMQALSNRLAELLKPFDAERKGQPLTSDLLLENGLISPEQHQSLQAHENDSEWVDSSVIESSTDPFDTWLKGQCCRYEVDYSEGDHEFAEDDIERNYEQLRELEAEQSSEKDEWENLWGKSIDLQISMRGKSPRLLRPGSISREAMDEYLLRPNLWSIPTAYRGIIYNILRRRLLEIVRERVRRLAGPYMEACKKMHIGKWERDHEFIKKAKILAMTTTGLNKYRPLINSIQPRIVMVEEAAEVTEAPLAAACFESLQHLILVGDHQQLKGHTSTHQLSGDPFYLDVSLFERLIKNGFPYAVLREQRRMVPEIRELLHPIYGQLTDHVSVHGHERVPGMGNVRSFFFNHKFPESGDSFSSKINGFEASMIVEFVLYLLWNGVSSDQITILTFYNGQKKLISRDLKTHKYLMDQPVKVVTVDSYQGEENDIVILSLVRSNNTGTIGFLSVDNRVCVALSRAKKGLYIVGNADCIKYSSPLWSSVIDIMYHRNNGSDIGDSLPLTCQKHGNRTMIKNRADWEKITGGCTLPCGDILGCGHVCPVMCHGSVARSTHTIPYNADLLKIDLIIPGLSAKAHVCISAPAVALAAPKPVENLIATNADDTTTRSPNAKSPSPKPQIPKSSNAENLPQTHREEYSMLPGEELEQRKQRENDARTNWNKFAGGGARQLDKFLHTLARSKDLNSIEVQQARANVDESLIPESFRADKSPQGTNKSVAKEMCLIDLDSE